MGCTAAEEEAAVVATAVDGGVEAAVGEEVQEAKYMCLIASLDAILAFLFFK